MPAIDRTRTIHALAVAAFCLGAGFPLTHAQTATTTAPTSATLDHYTPEQLMEMAKPLKEKAAATGTASIVLEKYPGHYTMLGYRDRSGGAELHKEYADIDVILDGTCTLIVGGTMPDAKTTGPGELRGAAVQGGQSTTLDRGDILHIPANVPHQMLLPPGGTLTYFVIKAHESQP
jgi:mannose-6-phosphate isomerase-like protein (cupin superfamily)